MNIKTWQERKGPNMGYANDCVFMQAEIDELRAEIERLKTVPMKYRRLAFNAQLQHENAAQRKVLEQALGALEYIKTRIEDGWNTTTQDRLREAAITAIQEQLK